MTNVSSNGPNRADDKDVSMETDTAKTLNWQLSQRLGLDPSIPHIINAETECDCWSSYTRDDSFRIWVESGEGRKGVSDQWDYLTDFIASLVKEGQPETLDGIAEAAIYAYADESISDGCRIESYWPPGKAGNRT